MYTNETIKKMLDHRSIREFKDKPVEPEKLEALKQVARATASSLGMQGSSIIRVTDEEKKKQLADQGKQEYVARSPEVWVFVVDSYRNTEIAKEKGSNPIPYGMDHFFGGFSDACLTAQNVMNAIESMDMGGVFLGNVLNDPSRVIEILELPEGTFPAVGMLFGYPNQEPQIKPKLPVEYRIFENRYERPESYVEALEEYDTVMHEYYDLRDANNRVDTFTDQCVKKYAKPVIMRNNVLKDIEKNGFQLYFEDEGNE